MINYIIGISAVLIVAAVIYTKVKAAKEGKSSCGCSGCQGQCSGCHTEPGD